MPFTPEASSYAIAAPKRIALLTPYSGRNLGDAAIQETITDAILQLRPDAEILMLTADPDNTQLLHGIPSFPMTGIFIPGYSNTIRVSNVVQPADLSVDSSGNDSWKSRVKATPVAARVIAPPYRLARAVLRFFRHIWNEGRHLLRALRLAHNLDVIVVSGGGQFDDYFGGPMAHPYTLAKWGWIARRAGCRYVILSVGVGQLTGRLSRSFVRASVRSAAYLSFRDQGSRRLMSFIEEAKDLPIVPDLALGYPPHRIPKRQPRRDSEPLRVGLAPIAYLSRYGWPEVDDTVFERYFDCLLQFCRLLLSRSMKLGLFYTDVPDDKVVLRLAQALQDSAPESPTRLSVRHCDTTGKLLATLAEFDTIVASRLHALILAHVSGLPALAISYERKVIAHMSDMGQQQHCIDLHDIRLQELVSTFDRLAARLSESAETVNHGVAANRRSLDEQYARVFGGQPVSES